MLITEYLIILLKIIIIFKLKLIKIFRLLNKYFKYLIAFVKNERSIRPFSLTFLVLTLEQLFSTYL